MPAKQKTCGFCNKLYWATRSDAKWCSDRCRMRNQLENVRFEIPSIPKSGVEGVTFKRYSHRWTVQAKVGEGKRKYVGSFKEKQEAINFLEEVEGRKVWK